MHPLALRRTVVGKHHHGFDFDSVIDWALRLRVVMDLVCALLWIGVDSTLSFVCVLFGNIKNLKPI
jgi:hypothetical protein